VGVTIEVSRRVCRREKEGAVNEEGALAHLCISEFRHVSVGVDPGGQRERHRACQEDEDRHDRGDNPVLASADDPYPPAVLSGLVSERDTHDAWWGDAREEPLREQHVRPRDAGVDDEVGRKEGEDVWVRERLDSVQPRPCAVVDGVAECTQREKADEHLEGEAVCRAEPQEIGRGCRTSGSGQVWRSGLAPCRQVEECGQRHVPM